MRVHYKPLVLLGLFEAITLMLQMTAVVSGLVSYVISLKRTSAFWAIVLGAIIFKERNIKTRFIGTLLMILGVVLISLG